MNKSSRITLPSRTNVLKHPIQVLYEDDQYIVFNKPAGLLVIPTPKNERRTLVRIVNQQYASSDNTWKLHPCHRIDKETSGAVMFAKGKRSQKLMMDLFRRRDVKKKYMAFVHGQILHQTGEFRKPIRRPYGRKQTAMSAITRYKVLQTKKQYSIVEIQPVTGRTNQIRIHFSQAGHPLVGDRKYAFARDYALKFRRTALHAASLEFSHPVSHQKISVVSNLPKDMAELSGKS